jgi:Uma2 family endonuclease
MTVTAESVTADELWAMPDVQGKHLELINGEVVEVSGAGVLHGLIVDVVLHLLRTFVRAGNLGLVLPDNTGCILRRNPDMVRVPDASYVSWDRVPAEGIPQGFLPVAPDLAVEVVSPNDTAADVFGKVHDYLDAGTRMVWVLWPEYRSITLYHPDGSIVDLGPDDVLGGGDVLYGFTQKVSAFFETPVRPSNQTQ